MLELKKNKIQNKEYSNFYLKLLVTSLLLLNIGMLLGELKIVGRLAYSNIFQILAFALIVPNILRTYKVKHYIFIIINVSLLIIAELVVINMYNINPKFEHLVFFSLMLIYIQYFYLLNESIVIKDLIGNFYKYLIVPILIYFLIYTFKEFVIDGLSYVSLGFDDKSHTTMVCAFFAFISLAAFKTSYRFIISLLFMGIALLTISRLAVIFLCFYIIAFLYSFIKGFKTKSLFSIYFNFVFFVGTIFLSVWFVMNNFEKFVVFTRVSSFDAIQNSGSTISHLLLIKYGIQLKFDSIANILFGIGPGNFSLGAIYSGIDLSKFIYLDPTGYRAMLNGIMPMHSVHFSFFAEFSIYFFAVYIYLLIKIFKGLIEKRLFIEFMYFSAFIINTTFYSSHNELFYYSIIVYFLCKVDIGKTTKK